MDLSFSNVVLYLQAVKECVIIYETEDKAVTGFKYWGGYKFSHSKSTLMVHDSRFMPKRVAFTLAEVLITLGIIGVVAAITLPALIDSVTERKNSERHANIVYKVTQAMDIMKAHGELSGTYPSTEAFVDELQKYLKVSKRCNANNIADCWPTSKVTDGEGKEFEVSKARTGKNLSLNTDTNNVGLILADGTSIILNYNPDGGRIDDTDPIVAVKKSLPVGGGRSKEFVYTSNSTASIDFVTDVNGSAAPNAETSNNQYHDIRNLTAARFTKGCSGTELDGVGCVVVVGTSYDKIDTCNDSTWDNKGTANTNCADNYWAGAKAKCSSLGMSLPNFGVLQNIATQRNSNPNLPQSGFYWSSQQGNELRALTVNFANAGQFSSYKNNQHAILCVGD